MAEKLKTLAITLLSITMTVLILALFAIIAVSDALKLEDIVFEFFRKSEDIDTTASENETASISTPFQIALLKGNGVLYSPLSVDSFSNLYRSTMPITDEALGSATYIGELSENEFLFLLLNTGILYKYDNPLPLSFIFVDYSATEVDAKVKDLFIYNENNQVWLAVSSSDGKYYSFSTLSDPSYINILCGGYIENGQIAATYSNPELSYTGIIMSESFEMPSYTNVKADYEGELPKTIMSTLGMNPYLASVYRDGSSVIYMEGFHRVAIDEDGHLSYFSEEEGKGIAIDVDPQANAEEKFLQICTQSSGILQQLWTEISSSFVTLSFSIFEETDGGYILYFDAYIGGCLVNHSLHSAAALQIDDGKIINISVHPLRLERAENISLLPYKQAAAVAPAKSCIAVQYTIDDDLLTPATVFIKEETP